MWSRDKRSALNRIEQELERRDIYQGSAYGDTKTEKNTHVDLRMYNGHMARPSVRDDLP